MRRVVVTGMGLVSPLGNTMPSSWSSLINGHSGIQLYHNDSILQNKNPYNMALVKNFDLKSWKIPHASNRLNSFLASAADEAIQHSQLDFSQIDKTRVGICIGVMSSNLTKVYEFAQQSKGDNYKSINRLSMLHLLSNIPSGTLNVKYKIKGPSLTVSTACASGLSAIVEGYKWIRLNEADVVIVGAGEDVYSPLCLNSSIRLQAMTTKQYEKPQHASCPFDKMRSGFVLGEGSGVIVLESEQHAKNRKAEIIGQILGYGYTSDGYHLVRPQQSGEGQISSMTKALQMANKQPEDIDFISTHATSTPTGDEIEARSIKKIFNHRPHVTANKGAIGHTFGAAGSIEFILAMEGLRRGIVPKIMNLKNPDIEGLNYAVENVEKEMNACVKNSFGFGGVNVSMVIGKYKG